MYNFSNSKKGRTLVSIIVWVAILAIAISGIAMILFQNRTIEDDYGKTNHITLLQSNAETIVRKVDTSHLSEKDIFFLCKDDSTGVFAAFTGALGESCKYIDKNGDKVTNTGSFADTIYTRIFSIEKRIIPVVNQDR